MMVVTDADPLRFLLEAAREGDDVAVAELVRLTQGRVLRLCVMLGSDGEQDDLVQETYIRAFRSLDSFRGDAPIEVWLLAIARRVCADHVRRRQRHRRLVSRIKQFTVPGSQPAHEVESDLLDGLESDRREAFVLTQMVGMSYAEAAEVIGCPIGTVRSRVSRARGDLLDAVQRADAMEA